MKLLSAIAGSADERLKNKSHVAATIAGYRLCAARMYKLHLFATLWIRASLASMQGSRTDPEKLNLRLPQVNSVTEIVGFKVGSWLLIGKQGFGGEKLTRLTQEEHLMKERVKTNRTIKARLIRQPKNVETSAATGGRNEDLIGFQHLKKRGPKMRGQYASRHLGRQPARLESVPRHEIECQLNPCDLTTTICIMEGPNRQSEEALQTTGSILG